MDAIVYPTHNPLFIVLSNQVSHSCVLPYLSHRYHRFLSDYDELTGWMKEKTALINADELPTDVASGEALLARHQQHKVRSKGFPGRIKKVGRDFVQC